MVAQWIIEKKRDGRALTETELRTFIQRYTEGTLPDYQMAAFAMAVFFQGMSDDEVSVLTDAMLNSGTRIDTTPLRVPTADKHSTGGIGDKVSLILAPLVACCGVAVPMISGRGLGITGGTLDKLESIPGYRTDLSIDAFMSVLQSCGCSITGQTEALVPADKKLYALRDVTGTVPSIPLIAASIMSKKLAEGAATLVLDVKCGSGAFMKSSEDARRLAGTMVDIGRRMGRGMTALITAMNEPLGTTVGNSLEIAEAIAALQGHGATDLMEITLALAGEMLLLTGVADGGADATRLLKKQLDSGRAFEKLKQMVELHGGDPRVLDMPSRLPQTLNRCPVSASASGFITAMNAEKIGQAALLLGAGRTQVSDRINPAVGLSGIRKTGERVEKGEPLMVLHASGSSDTRAALAMAAEAVMLSDVTPAPVKHILETIRTPGSP